MVEPTDSKACDHMQKFVFANQFRGGGCLKSYLVCVYLGLNSLQLYIYFLTLWLEYLVVDLINRYGSC